MHIKNNSMHISVFCGASLPHSEQITEAARQLGRAIARGGHLPIVEINAYKL